VVPAVWQGDRGGTGNRLEQEIDRRPIGLRRRLLNVIRALGGRRTIPRGEKSGLAEAAVLRR
jgi:hypothetical protein